MILSKPSDTEEQSDSQYKNNPVQRKKKRRKRLAVYINPKTGEKKWGPSYCHRLKFQHQTKRYIEWPISGDEENEEEQEEQGTMVDDQQIKESTTTKHSGTEQEEIKIDFDETYSYLELSQSQSEMLRQFSRDHGLKVGGNRDQLAERIYEYFLTVREMPYSSSSDEDHDERMWPSIPKSMQNQSIQTTSIQKQQQTMVIQWQDLQERHEQAFRMHDDDDD